METEKRFALLIDADNVSPKYLAIMLDEAKAYGEVSIRRIYGDWTDVSKGTWKESLLDNSIIPIQQYSYTSGKNSSDSAMIIDAMDILYADSVDGFIIASSDSDFTRLAMRLRESRKTVIGMGESKTPSAFVRACEEFKVLDVLFQNSLSEEERKAMKKASGEREEKLEEATPITGVAEIRRSVKEILDSHSEDGEMLLSELGRLLTKKHPDFDARNYGKYKRLGEFIKEVVGLEVYPVRIERGKQPVSYVKSKRK